MSADSRTVHTDALETLGTVIGPDEKRDAIHLAVEPVQAGALLGPGDRVVLRGGLAYRAVGAEQWVGIVDPFLDNSLHPGQYFWVVLPPRQITSLRHVWEHPAFPPSQDLQPRADRSRSEEWMRAWAVQHMSDDYYGDGDRLPEDVAYQSAIRAGHNHHVGPHEDAREHIDNEWWGHWEAITGQRGDRDSYFSCGC